MFSGEFVEDAFLKTAQKIYECIQDGRYVLFDLLLIQHYIELDWKTYCDAIINFLITHSPPCLVLLYLLFTIKNVLSIRPRAHWTVLRDEH